MWCVFLNKAWPYNITCAFKAHASGHVFVYNLCVCVFCVVRGRPCFFCFVFGHQGRYTHTHTHWAIPNRLYKTPLSHSIRYSTQWTHADKGQTQLSWSPPCPTESVQPLTANLCGSPVGVVRREGLTERHLHVRKSPPWSRLQIFTPHWVNTKNCTQFLFVLFYT